MELRVYKETKAHSLVIRETWVPKEILEIKVFKVIEVHKVHKVTKAL